MLLNQLLLKKKGIIRENPMVKRIITICQVYVFSSSTAIYFEREIYMDASKIDGNKHI